MDFTSSVTMVDPFKALLVLMFISLLVERALTAIYSTSAWRSFKKHVVRDLSDIKLYVAIVVNLALAFIINLDAFVILGAAPDSTILGIVLTGLFNSGGAKAWADIYNAYHDAQQGKADSVKAKAYRDKTNAGIK